MSVTLDPALLFANHPDPMWLYDLDSLAFLAVNNAACSRYGYSRDEFLAMTLGDIDLDGDGPRLADTTAAAGIRRHRLKSGAIIHGEVNTQPLEYPGRRAAWMVARDVTRLVALEAEHRALLDSEREANLRTAQRLLGLGVWKQNIDTLELYWSASVFTMFGIAREDFANNLEAYLALVHPDDREATMRKFRAYVAAPDTHFEFRHRILRPDGSILHMRGIGELTARDGQRVLTGVVQDISAEVEAEARLAAATSLQRIAGHAAHLGGWRVDLAGGVVEWSEETVAIHEADRHLHSVDEAIEFYAPEYRDRIRQLFAACRERGEPFDEQLVLVTGKGNRRWVRSIGEAEYDDHGRICAVRGAFQEVTELVAAREQSESLSRRLHNTLANMSDAFFLLDGNFCFAFLNHQAERLLRRRSRDLVGQPVWQEFPAATHLAFKTQYEQAVASGDSVHFTSYFPPLETWFKVDAFPGPEGLAVYFRDVTRERERDQQLRLLEAAVARQNDILLITEADPIAAPHGPRIIYVNDAFARRTGYSPAEAIGSTPRILQGPQTQAGELARIRTALEAGQSVRAELINYTKGGEEFWLELDIVPLTDGDGRRTHWVAVARDITQRKAFENEARINQERFRLVARATNDVVWDWDLSSDTVWWNEAMEHLFGYPLAHLEPGPESWSSRIHPEDRERVLASIHGVIDSTASNWQQEYRFIHANGKPLLVIDRGFVIRGSGGEAVRMVGSMLDVTERRELTERLRQSQKLEAVGQLTGGVAHDFNNLLTVILGNSELLKEQLTDQQQLRMLAEMTNTAAERGAELTSRLLAFARRQALEPKLVDINRLVSGMEPMLRRTLSENIEIEMVRGGGLWASEVDPGQLESALLNMAINARDAMPEGGHLTIETANAMLDDIYARAHHEVSAGQYVLVSVSDTGAGMTADIAGQAFEPFFTTKQVGKGSGLGLSMVYGFVKQSGGHAKIYSEPGEGTTIKLYFPRALANGEKLYTLPGESAVTGGREHILVVEDDDLVRNHVISLLGGLGYRVTSTASGAEAMAELRRNVPIDLLFTDVIMPGGMNGRQLADAAQGLRPGLKVLFTSGYTENAIVHHGRLDHGVNLLGKPYRRQELAAKVRKVLDEKEG